VADDYRLTVEFEDPDHGLRLTRILHEHQVEEEVRDELGQRVVVSRDGPRVHVYTGTLKEAEAASRVVNEVIAEHDLDANVLALARWHPVEERWEDASVPLPASDAEVESEHERWEEQQAKETRDLGYAEWEVRVDLPSHAEAEKLAELLEAEGIRPIVRRSKFLLIGTENDDQARELAERIGTQVPKGAVVTAEPSATIGWELTASNPFAVFGGFGPGPTL